MDALINELDDGFSIFVGASLVCESVVEGALCAQSLEGLRLREREVVRQNFEQASVITFVLEDYQRRWGLSDPESYNLLCEAMKAFGVHYFASSRLYARYGNRDAEHDLNLSVIAFKLHIVSLLRRELRRLKGLKFWLTVRVGMTLDKEDGGVREEEKCLRSNNHTLLPAGRVEQSVEAAILEVISEVDKLLLPSSGWVLTPVFFLDVSTVQFAPLRGSPYTPLPQYLRNPKLGLLNIKNAEDEQCFRWCCLTKLHPYRGPHRSATRHYIEFYDELDFGTRSCAG
ncbi:hypothetical protein ONE63_003588 [Megalurothrips usitatus]|uniref:Uncharacterized protein n=1 Tax=Megalurothrips usitatus TaxID=439358 RepID=A0AAV7X5Z8_9NEOP|nr:hypothetical protein ONE63_003588 [Megalurothrips usitatus]